MCIAVRVYNNIKQYIYIYIYVEREREEERDVLRDLISSRPLEQSGSRGVVHLGDAAAASRQEQYAGALEYVFEGPFCDCTKASEFRVQGIGA